MDISRRSFLKASLASAVAVNGLTIFSPKAVFGDDTVLIPHACHWGPFKAVVKNGVLIGVQPLSEFDAMPTKMLTEGLLSRVYDKTRVKYPMVRKSYLENPTGDTKPHLRGKEPFVRVSWDQALALAANAVLNPAENMAMRLYSVPPMAVGLMQGYCFPKCCRDGCSVSSLVTRPRKGTIPVVPLRSVCPTLSVIWRSIQLKPPGKLWPTIQR